MSDGHHEHNGGHELEDLDAGLLAKIIIVTLALVFISSLAVTMWFYKQRDEIQAQRANEGWSLLDEYKEEMGKSLKDIEKSRKEVLNNPAVGLAPLTPLAPGAESMSDILRRERALARGETPAPAAAAAPAPVVRGETPRPADPTPPPAPAEPTKTDGATPTGQPAPAEAADKAAPKNP